MKPYFVMQSNLILVVKLVVANTKHEGGLIPSGNMINQNSQ